jgi:cytochrome c556
MTMRSRGATIAPGALAVLLAVAGCGETPQGGNPAQAPGASAAANPNSGGPGPGAAPRGRNSPIRQIMAKLGRPRESLTPVIGNELKQDPPPWDALAPQTKEYSQLVADLARHDPPKGTKESWTQQTGAFGELATELDEAVQAKDRDAALAAHAEITNSCMGCHREHRVMGPGGTGGGRPGFGPPGQGGPPDGFRGPGGRPQAGAPDAGGPPSQGGPPM